MKNEVPVKLIGFAIILLSVGNLLDTCSHSRTNDRLQALEELHEVDK